ncbi:unnamed protein product, partial [Closterium sp. Yama58-4]
SSHRASCFRPCSGMGQSHRNNGMPPFLAHLSNSCPRILVLAPDSTLHHLALDAWPGVYALMHRYQEAVADFTKALEFNPDFYEARRRRGQTYTAMGRNDEAIKDLTAVIEARPTDWPAYMERGIAHFNARFIFQALSDLRTVTAHDPSNAQALFFLAQAHMHGGECAAAIPLLHRVKQLDPNLRGLLVQLGQAYKEESRLEEAEETYRQALEKEPQCILKGAIVRFHFHLPPEESCPKEPKPEYCGSRVYGGTTPLPYAPPVPAQSSCHTAAATPPPSLSVVGRNLLGYHLYSTLKHGMGYHREAMEIARKGLREADANDLDLRYMEASCLHALGYFPQAIQAYSAILALQLAPGVDQTKQFQAFYQRELTAYLAQRRGKPMTAYSIDDDMHPTFKELWAKRIAYAPLFPGYQLQPLRTALKLAAPETGGHNVRFSESVRRVLGAADELGKRTQYWCHGFLRNRRQHRMAGLAILDVRDMVRETWRRMRQGRGGEVVGEGGSGRGSGEGGESGRGRQRGKRRQQHQQQQQQQEQQEEGQKEEEQEQGRAGRRRGGAAGYVRRWRDIYDRVVRWRQLGEPIEPVVWIDKLTRKEFEDGFGSVTAMLVSQLKSTKYYFAFHRAFEIMKQQVKQRHMVWNGYEQAVPLSHTAVHQVENAETAEEAWKAIGQDYWVVTPCYSTARPGVVMNGTRLTMVKTPTYYEFSIKTPVVPTRWDEYDFEMETAWKDLCEAYLNDSLKASDVDAYRRRIHHAILRMGFYWYNFMPMARGTAMVGYVSMLGLFAAADMHVTADIPKGVQVDWEGILTPRVEDFIASLSEWMLPSIDYNSPVPQQNWVREMTLPTRLSSSTAVTVHSSGVAQSSSIAHSSTCLHAGSPRAAVRLESVQPLDGRPRSDHARPSYVLRRGIVAAATAQVVGTSNTHRLRDMGVFPDFCPPPSLVFFRHQSINPDPRSPPSGPSSPSRRPFPSLPRSLSSLRPFPRPPHRSTPSSFPPPKPTPGSADILLLNRVRSRALEELSEARMQNDGLQNQLRIFQARIAEADAKLHLAVQSRERSSLLETQLRVLQEQVEELGEADGEGEGESAGAEAEEEVVGELEKQVAELRARVQDGEEAEARLEILQGRNEALQREVEEGIRQAEAARRRAEEVERRLREEMEGLTERLVRLQAELAVSQAKEKELGEAVAVKGLLEREVGDLRGKVAEKEAEMAQAVREREEEVERLRERLEREVGELGEKVREEGEKRRAAEEERERLDGEIAALKTEVEEREEALRRELEEVAGKLRREVEEREAVVGEEVQEREALVARLKQEVDELTEKVGDKERERERAEAEVGELRKRVEAAEEVVRAKQGEVEELQEEQAQELRALVARLGEETAQMRKALEGKEREVEEVEAARGKLEEVVRRTEGWLGEVRGENADLRAQLAALQQQVAEAEEKRELVVQLTEEEEREREEQRQQLMLQLQQAQERVGELERKQEMVAKVEAEISLLQSAIEEAEGLERISAAVAEQNEELQGELARLREEVAAAEAARAQEQEERQAEKEEWWRLAEETEAYRAQVGVLRSELMKTDELMRAQLELYEAQMAAFQESLDAANESVEVYRARAEEATAAAEEAAAMAAEAEAVAAQWEEAAASGALGELNLDGMTSGFVTSGSSSSSSSSMGGRWQRPAVVAAGELPWEYWSSLLLKLDELLLRRVLTTEELDELRDMAWRREKAIREAWDSVGGAEVVQAVAAGGNSDAVLGRDAVVAGALRGVLGGEQPPLPPLHVVHIAAEMAPVAKVGGLADVITGLSKALQRRGHLVEIILPKYDCMDYSRINDLKPLDLKFSSFFDNEMHACKIWRGMVEGLPVYFIEPLHPARMFWRGTFYGCNDDFRRFTLFCRAALEFLLVSHKRPDIIHTHDWQTAVVAPLYWDVYVPRGLNSAQLAFTCHNFEYQGTEHASALAACGLDVNRHNVPERMRDNFMHDRVNLLKAGIVFSGVVTTVSPTYAMEVRGPEGGRGLHLTLGQHEKKFFGVLNGIDSEVWDPATDPLLCCPYSAAEPEGKAENKAYLKSMLGLSSSGPDAHKPLVGCITRLVPQKGVHLIRHAIYRTLERGGQFVLLGSSPVPDIQKDFEGIERQFSSDPNIRLVLKYDESLSHLIYAASDLFIIPSIFEPCGLTQLIAMRYGSIPIVRKTGGLADSVFDVDDPSIPVEKRNGFSFTASDVNALNYALDRAITAYYERREWWVQLVAHTMAMDFGWEQSSRQYEHLYHRCLPHRRTW